jgi:uncharacterized OsmC-like protein
MSDRGLRDYIRRKREAMARSAAERPRAEQWRETVEARVVADDDTGARKLHIRGWEYIGDSGPAFGGQGLGPSSPELLCGVIGTCLAHTYEIGAATLDIPLDRIEIRVTALNNDAGLLGIASDDPDLPWEITAFVTVEAEGVDPAKVSRLHAWVGERCPLTRLIRTPNSLEIVVAQQGREPGPLRRW